MKKVLLPLVIVPAVILILVTVLRAWFELQPPDSSMTKMLSASVLSLLWSVEGEGKGSSRSCASGGRVT